MKGREHIQIQQETIDELLTRFPVRTFKTHSHLFYEGQVPISGYLIISGNIQISKKRKSKKILNKGTLIGINELLNKNPIGISAEVFPNSEICFLDRSTIIEVLEQVGKDGNNEDEHLADVLKNIIEIRKWVPVFTVIKK